MKKLFILFTLIFASCAGSYAQVPNRIHFDVHVGDPNDNYNGLLDLEPSSYEEGSIAYTDGEITPGDGRGGDYVHNGTEWVAISVGDIEWDGVLPIPTVPEGTRIILTKDAHETWNGTYLWQGDELTYSNDNTDEEYISLSGYKLKERPKKPFNYAGVVPSFPKAINPKEIQGLRIDIDFFNKTGNELVSTVGNEVFTIPLRVNTSDDSVQTPDGLDLNETWFYRSFSSFVSYFDGSTGSNLENTTEASLLLMFKAPVNTIDEAEGFGKSLGAGLTDGNLSDGLIIRSFDSFLMGDRNNFFPKVYSRHPADQAEWVVGSVRARYDATNDETIFNLRYGGIGYDIPQSGNRLDLITAISIRGEDHIFRNFYAYNRYLSDAEIDGASQYLYETVSNNEIIDIYMIAGQSNADWQYGGTDLTEQGFYYAGMNRVEGDPNFSFDREKSLYLGRQPHNTSAWQKQLTPPDDVGGILYGFLQEMQRDSNEKLGKIGGLATKRSATALYKGFDDSVDGRYIYELMRDHMKCRLTTLQGRGYKPRVRRLIWMQGETDANVPETTKEIYKEAFKSMYAMLMSDLNLSDVPVLFTAISDLDPDQREANGRFRDRIQDAQKELAKENSGWLIVPTDDMERGDVNHYTPEEHDRIGRRAYLATKQPHLFMR